MATLNNVIANANGCVGIGTTSPAQKLHVAGNARIDGIGAYGIVQSNWNSSIYGIEIGGVGNALWANAGSYIELNNNGYFDSGGWKYANSAASSRYELGIGAHYWFTAASGTAGNALTWSEKMRLDNNGNVGIGTTSPTSKLHIVGGSSNQLKVEGGEADLWLVSQNIGATWRILGSFGNTTKLFRIYDQDNGSDRFNINSSGNVGIGTTNPTGSLHVYKAVGVGETNIVTIQEGAGGAAELVFRAGNASTNRRGALRFFSNQVSTTTAQWTVGASLSQSSGDNSFYFYNNGSTSVLTLSQTNVGIGSTAPNDKLDVVGRVYAYRYIAVSSNASLPAYATDTSTGMFNAATNQIGFSISGTEKVRIDTNGNVGIGTTSPADKLEIEGGIRLRTGGGITLRNVTNDSSAAIYNAGGAAGSVIYLAVGPSPTMTIGSNVGIGTTSPAAKLAITADQSVYNNDTSQLIITGATSTSKRLILGYNTSTDKGFIQATNTAENYKDLLLNPNSGNVGIGTSSPSQKLDVVSGSMRVASAAGAGEIYFGTTDSTNIYLKRDNNYDLTLAQHASSGNALYLAGAGNVYLSIDSNNNETTAAFIVQNNSIKSGSELFRVNEAGNVGIGSSSPSAKLDVVDAGNFFVTRDANGYPRFTTTNGSAQLGLFRSGTSAGGFYIGGDASVFSVWDSSFSRLVNINTSGNIGINVASPLTKLDIANTQGGGITMRFDTSTSYQAWIRPYWNSTTDSRVDFAINRAGGSTPDVIMSVGYGGNVGIGTTSPGALLAVNGDAFFAAKITIKGSAAGSLGNSSGLQMYQDSSTDTSYLYNYYAGAMVFGTNNVERMRITSTGNIGINASDPDGTTLRIVPFSTDAVQRALHIGYAGSMSTGINGSYISFGNGNPSTNQLARIASYYEGATYQGSLRFYTNSNTDGANPTERMRVDYTGNVGIGTTSPAGTLHIEGTLVMSRVSILNSAKVSINGDGTNPIFGLQLNSTTNTISIFDVFNSGGTNFAAIKGDTSNKALTFNVGASSATERIRIQSDGNVGIGTSSPSYLFTVKGGVAKIIGSHDNNSGIYLSSTATDRPVVSFRVSDNSERAKIEINNVNNSNGDRLGFFVYSAIGVNERVSILGNGNVGIGTTDPTSKLNAYGSGSNLSVFKAEGGNGTLFEITDQLSGSLFSVNTIAGIPILEVFSNNRLVAGQYGSNALVISGSKVGIGLATPLSNKSLSISGDAQVLGSFTKASGTFLIDHPDPAKSGWKLQHSFVESPTVGDNIYRYIIDIDNTLSGSIELPSYWKFLNENPQIWISPVKHFGVAYGEINDEVSGMNVYANNVGKYNVLLIGTRKDPTIKRLMPEFNVEFESE